MRISQTSLSFLVTGLVLALGLVNSVLLARWLGPTGRGEVAAALLWPLMIPYLGAMGMVDAVIVFAARSNSDAKKVLSSSLVFGAMLSIVLVPLAYVILPFLLGNQQPEVVHASRVLLFAVPVVLVGEFVVNLLRARMLIGLYNLGRLVVPAGYLSGTILLYLTDKLSVMNIVILLVVLVIIRLVVVFALCWIAKVELGIRFDWMLLKRMLSFAGKSHIGSVAEHGNSQLDQALIAAWLPPAQLGLYVAAVSVTSIIKSVSIALKISILPLVAGQVDVTRQNYWMVRAFRVYWTLSWIVSPFFALSLYWVIPLVYGSDFTDAVVPAIILILGSVLFGGKDLLTTSAKAIGLPWLGSMAELVALLVTVVLLVALLPIMGIAGAAVTSVVAHAISLGLVMRGIRRERLIPFRSLLIPALGELNIVQGVLRIHRRTT